MSNWRFKDHIRLDRWDNGQVNLSFKEILYLAERVEAMSVRPTITPRLLRGLVADFLTKSQRQVAYRRLLWVYKLWPGREQIDPRSVYVYPFLKLAREREEQKIFRYPSNTYENRDSKVLDSSAKIPS